MKNAPRQQLNRTTRAFTLIEMTVVISVLLLMAALIMPNLIALKRSREIRDLESALLRLPAEARNEARRSRVPVTLRLDGDAVVMEKGGASETTAGNSSSQPPSLGQPADAADDAGPQEVKRIELLDEVRLEAARQNNEPIDTASWTWVVYPDGSADSGGLEFSEGQTRRRSLMLPARESEVARWVDGELPDEQDNERWPAGEIEQRG